MSNFFLISPSIPNRPFQLVPLIIPRVCYVNSHFSGYSGFLSENALPLILFLYYRLNVCLSPPSQDFVETLTTNIMIFGGGALGR